MIVVINVIIIFSCLFLLCYIIDGSIYSFKKLDKQTRHCLLTGVGLYVVQYFVANGEIPNNFLAGILDKIVDAIFVYGIFRAYTTLNKVEDEQ